MTRFNLYSIFLACLLSPLGISAQSDYLVNTKGDTLKGTVKFQVMGNVEQASVKGLKKETLTALSIRVVYLKGVRYKPVQYAGTVKLMQIITDGYLSLLGFQPQGIMNYDGRILQKRDGAMIEVPSLGFKKQMANFLQDDEALANQIKDGTLDRKDLNTIITEYNQFIVGKTASQNIQVKISENQKSLSDQQAGKLELLYDLKTAIEKTEMDSKQDVLDMISEMEGKIKEDKAVPNYLIESLKGKISNQSTLLTKLEVLLEGLK